MTKKDYILLAKALSSAYSEAEHVPSGKQRDRFLDGLGNALYYLCIHLQDDNPKFRKDTFIKACRGKW